jgi:hypothetical protein
VAFGRLSGRGGVWSSVAMSGSSSSSVKVSQGRYVYVAVGGGWLVGGVGEALGLVAHVGGECSGVDGGFGAG